MPDALGFVSATVLIAASFFTSGLTAAAGIGGGLLMLALMTYLLPIAVLIPVHGLVQLASNAGRSWVQRPNINWRVTILFLVGTVSGCAHWRPDRGSTAQTGAADNHGPVHLVCSLGQNTSAKNNQSSHHHRRGRGYNLYVNVRWRNRPACRGVLKQTF